MYYRELRDFLTRLETVRELKAIQEPVSAKLEMTALCDAVLKKGGPALLFNNVPNYSMPVLANLFGTPKRIAMAMGMDPNITASEDILTTFRELGLWLAYLKEPIPPRGLRDIWEKWPILKKVFTMAPKIVKKAVCQQNIEEAEAVDLSIFPIQHCWPGDVAPLITWGITVTQGPYKPRQNLGIYRLQVIAKNRVIMRWLAHRGGALDFQDHQKCYPGQPFPVSVIVGCDPATILAAVTPLPDAMSEYQFAGLLRGHKTELVQCIGNTLTVPASAEIILEGVIYPNDYAIEGPYGDHTGYYNEQEKFPVLTINRITRRSDPIYHSTYTGKPPDEPAILGLALNEVFVPLLQKQFPEIIDFYLPAEGCSYRLAIVSIRKQYPGHAKRIMFGIWSFLRQFMYTKFIIVVDEDIMIRNWAEVIWAITTRVDPTRDTTLIDHTPIDYLDFASPISGLGSKMGLDATNKWPTETQRQWGSCIKMEPAVTEKMDKLIAALQL